MTKLTPALMLFVALLFACAIVLGDPPNNRCASLRNGCTSDCIPDDDPSKQQSMKAVNPVQYRGCTGPAEGKDCFFVDANNNFMWCQCATWIFYSNRDCNPGENDSFEVQRLPKKQECADMTRSDTCGLPV